MPPGVVNIDKTFDREVKTNADIRIAIPSDTIAIRKKSESRGTMRPGHASKAGTLSKDRTTMTSKTITKMSTNIKKDEKEGGVMQRAKALMEVNYEKIPAREVDFEMLYKDKLPEDALEL